MSNYLNRDRYDGAPTPQEWERDERRKSLWRELFGIEPPEWEPEASAPVITAELREKMLALARRELPLEEAVDFELYLLRFRSLYDCFLGINREEARKRQREKN